VRVDPDGLQYSSPPVEGLVLHNSCTLPVHVVILMVDMDCNAILLIESPHSLLVLCQLLLQGSSCLAYVDMVTVMLGNLVDHSSLLLLRYSVLHIDKGLSDSPVRFGDQLQVDCLDVPTDSVYLLCYSFDVGRHRIFFSAFSSVAGWAGC